MTRMVKDNRTKNKKNLKQNDNSQSGKGISVGLSRSKNMNASLNPTFDTGINFKIDLNASDSLTTNQIHAKKIASIASMPSRVDKQIGLINSLQQQLGELQSEQLRLLDGCIEFFKELNAVTPKNDEEAKLVQEIFDTVKLKLNGVFEGCLPNKKEVKKDR